jgi:predicted dehydrogenase
MIGIAVVGYGYWGPNLVRNFVETPDAQVVSVCDRREDRLALVRRRFPGVHTTREFAEVLRDPRVDAIVVATPVAGHFPLAQAALESGRHVLIEKPLASSSKEALALIELAAQRDRVLLVDHTFVYTGAVRRIRELVAEEYLGTLRYCDAVRINLGLFQPDVNVLWDLAVHDLSIMDYVFPEKPVAVSATGTRHLPGRSESVGYLTLFYSSDLIAHVHASWLAPVKVRRMLIGGSRQMIVYDDVEPSEKVKLYDRGITTSHSEEAMHNLLVGYRMGDMWAPQLDMMEALQREARHFVECIEGHLQPITDGEAGLRVVRILEAAAESIAARGRPVEINVGAHV